MSFSSSDVIPSGRRQSPQPLYVPSSFSKAEWPRLDPQHPQNRNMIVERAVRVPDFSGRLHGQKFPPDVPTIQDDPASLQMVSDGTHECEKGVSSSRHSVEAMMHRTLSAARP